MLLVLGVRQWRRHAPAQSQPTPDEVAPFDLSVAVGFGAFLGLMAVLSRAAHDWLGDSGLYGLAVLSGLADVDAIVISVSRLQAGGGLSVTAAGLAIALTMLT